MNPYLHFPDYANASTFTSMAGFKHLDEISNCYQPSTPFLGEYNETRNVVLPTRRWSHGDSQHASIGTTAPDYHNLGSFRHNNISMSNHRCTSGYNSNLNVPFASLTEPEEHPQLPSFNSTNVQHVQSFSHNFYEVPLPHLSYYENEQRSLSAPGINSQNINALQNLPNHAPKTTGCAGRRRFRTNFTEHQSLFLEDSFRESHYPDHKAKKRMSDILSIPEDRITVWFQNRRAKWRRKEQRHKNQNKIENQSDESTLEYIPSVDLNGPTFQAENSRIYHVNGNTRLFDANSGNC